MQRHISTFLLLAFVLTLAACGGASEPNAANEPVQNSPRTSSDEQLTQPEQTQTTQTTPDETGYAEKVIFNQDGITITFIGFDADFEPWGPEIMFFVENSSDKSYLIQARSFLVNGIPVAPQLSLRYDPGDRELMPLYILRSGLYSNDITDIENVELSFYLMESSTTTNVIESDIIFLDLTL